MSDDNARARAEIQRLQAGGAVNGHRPEEFGVWAEMIAILYQATREGHLQPTLQTLINADLKKGGRTIARLLSGEDTSGGAWGSVIPFHSLDLPAFPTEVLPNWLRAFVEAEAEATQTPPDLAGMLALSVLSAACARFVAVRPKPGWVEPVNIYTITALPPASRKSPVFAAMIAPLAEEERRIASESAIDIAQARAHLEIAEARLNDAKREAAKATGESATLSALEKVDELAADIARMQVPAQRRLIVDDISTEKLGTMLVEQGGRIAALSPEGDIFGIMAGRYSANSAPNFGVYLKAHAGDTLRVDRKGSPSEFVERPALTFGLTVQPEVLRGLGEKEIFRGLGLLGRFLYAIPKSLIGTRRANAPSVPSGVRQTYHDNVIHLLRMVPVLATDYSANNANNANIDTGSHFDYIYILEYSPEAAARLQEFQEWLEPQLAEGAEFGSFTDWAGKLDGAIVRLSGLLHMVSIPFLSSHNSHNSHIISLDTLERAIALADYLIPHARAAFAEIGADPSVNAARYVLAWLGKRRLSTFTKRDAFEGCKGRFKRASDLDPVLELLADHNYIRPQDMDERPGPGRKPSPIFDAHPAVWAY